MYKLWKINKLNTSMLRTWKTIVLQFKTLFEQKQMIELCILIYRELQTLISWEETLVVMLYTINDFDIISTDKLY